jgi:hypothetical protein
MVLHGWGFTITAHLGGGEDGEKAAVRCVSADKLCNYDKCRIVCSVVDGIHTSCSIPCKTCAVVIVLGTRGSSSDSYGIRERDDS